jgi:hypothetical protein
MYGCLEVVYWERQEFLGDRELIYFVRHQWHRYLLGRVDPYYVFVPSISLWVVPKV